MGPSYWCRVQSTYASSDGSRLVETPDFLCSMDENALSWSVRFDQIRSIEPHGFVARVVTKSGKGLWSLAMGYGYDWDESGRIDDTDSLVFVFDEGDVTIRISWRDLERLEFLEQPEIRTPAPGWIRRMPLELPPGGH
jgi:hypothetical protein